jgi:hypothetical protein
MCELWPNVNAALIGLSVFFFFPLLPVPLLTAIHSKAVVFHLGKIRVMTLIHAK